VSPPGKRYWGKTVPQKKKVLTNSENKHAAKHNSLFLGWLPTHAPTVHVAVPNDMGMSWHAVVVTPLRRALRQCPLSVRTTSWLPWRLLVLHTGVLCRLGHFAPY
jgi:hypothetical protein